MIVVDPGKIIDELGLFLPRNGIWVIVSHIWPQQTKIEIFRSILKLVGKSVAIEDAAMDKRLASWCDRFINVIALYDLIRTCIQRKSANNWFFSSSRIGNWLQINIRHSFSCQNQKRIRSSTMPLSGFDHDHIKRPIIIIFAISHLVLPHGVIIVG